jgi:hypothetical protein
MTDAPIDAMTEELDFRYGLGWTLKDVEGLRVVSHAGSMGGVATILALLPARRAAIAVLANSTGSGLPWIVGRGLIGALLEPSAPDLRRVWDEGPAQPETLRPDVAAGLVGRWQGEISTPEGDVPFGLELRGDGMALASLDGGPMVGATVSRDPAIGLALEVPLRLPTTDARVRTDLIACSLGVFGDALRGTANAEARLAEDPDGARRYGNSLPHPCELRRV